MVRDRKKPHLGHQPAECRCCRCRQKQPGKPAQRRLAQRKEGCLLLALPVQPDGLQCADIPRYEGEDGHADAALDENPEVRQLQEAWRRGLGRSGGEEIAFPAAGDVSCDYEEGGDAAKALQFWEEGGHVSIFQTNFLVSQHFACLCIIRLS